MSDPQRPVPDVALDPVELPGGEPAPTAHDGAAASAPPATRRARAARSSAAAASAEAAASSASAEAVAPPASVAPSAADDPPAAEIPLVVTAHVEAPSPDVVLPEDVAALPGEHRGGFTTPPTAPIAVAEFEVHPFEVEFDPDAPAADAATLVAPAPWSPGGYALLFAIVGLGASFLVGWTFPLGIIGVVLGIIAVRRPTQRRMGLWAIPLSALSLVYSAGWLVYAATQF